MNKFTQCPYGHYYSADLDSCPYCKSNSTLLRCHICGWKNPIGSQTCEKCNTPLLKSQLEDISKEPPLWAPTDNAMCYGSFPQDWPDNNTIEIIDDDTAVKKQSTRRDVLRFGRANDNDVVINGRTVSYHHMEIRKHYDGRIVLRDLMSSHGTFVNDKDIEDKPYELHRGDIVKMGDVTVSWEDYFIDEEIKS